MLDDLTVLGRDGAGDWHHKEAGLSLGRTQFFNTPESCGESPVVRHEGCILIWEGRLDDRRSLVAGRPQVTDAELLIEAYRRWGTDCVKHLVGEFAFVLWDSQQEILFASADPMGCRSLTYFWNEKTLLIASRAIALLRHPAVDRSLNKLYLIHTVGYLNAHPPGSTPFQSIHRLVPGEGLLLKAGRLRKLKIAELEAPKRFNKAKSADEYYEEFWQLMNAAVSDRLRSHGKVCTTLSGGLDSTTVTISLLNQLSSIEAFSNITTAFPEFDEREPIKAFLAAYPAVKWQGVNANSAWSFTESWDQLPLPDDPLSFGTLAMDLRLMKALQTADCRTIFNGIWGDHLFFTGWQDIAKARNWHLVLKRLQHRRFWPAVLWRDFLLPSAPSAVQNRLLDRWYKKRKPLPNWIYPAQYQDADMRLALRQYFHQHIVESMPQFLRNSVASTHALGGLQAYKLLNSYHGIEAVAPFQDKRLIQFAFNLPPALQYHHSFNKIFLRRANADKLPNEIRWRPKTNFFDPLAYKGLGEIAEIESIRETIQQSEVLSSIVNVSDLMRFISQYQSDYSKGRSRFSQHPPSAVFPVCSLIAFSRWHSRLNNALAKMKWS